MGVGVPDDGGNDRTESLTFGWLYERVQQYVRDSSQSSPSRLETWSFWIGLGLAGLGLTSPFLASWMPAEWLVWMAAGCLLGELAGIGLSAGLMIKRELPQFRRPRETHAKELDLDFANWAEIIADLRRFTTKDRSRRLRFLSNLRHAMNDRMGLLFGGIQRLGVFPLLIALYLQFRDWEWGDWRGAFDVNLVAGLLIWAMILLYGAGWLLVGLRTRLDTYVAILEGSLED